MKAWYLVYSKPRQERKAVENLERQGYRTYLPLARLSRRVGGRYRRIVEPMFPRYLMIRLDDQDDDWGPIRSTLGVSGLVRFAGVPARVPDTLVAAMRQRDGADGVQELPDPALAVGDRVRIVDGLMAGYEAIVQARSGNERVVVLLEIAEAAARVTLDRVALEPLNPDWSFDSRRSQRRRG